MLTLLWMRLHRLHSKVSGEATLVRRFTPDLDVPIATPSDEDGKRSKVTDLDGGWRFVSNHRRAFELFDVDGAELAGNKLSYRAELCCRDVNGRACLELWCRIPGAGEYYSRGVHTSIHGTRTWQPCETSIRIRPGAQPDRIRLCLSIDRSGMVEMRDVSLEKHPLVRVPLWQTALLFPPLLVWWAMRAITFIVLNAVLIGFSFWAEGPQALTWSPRARESQLGKRKH